MLTTNVKKKKKSSKPSDVLVMKFFGFQCENFTESSILLVFLFWYPSTGMSPLAAFWFPEMSEQEDTQF
jgi:hypothetical protein